MALNRVWMPSPFYSGRGGAGVTTIVIHTAEGATTIESLGGWFQNPTAQVSSHTGADDKANTVGEYVKRDMKGWTQGDANGWCVSLELCGFAAWDSAEWQRHPNMLANCAAWIGEEAAAFGIPIVGLTPAQAQDPNTRGVCQHIDLGQMGGGHVDCGDGFPFDQVLAMASGGGDDMPLNADDKQWITDAVNSAVNMQLRTLFSPGNECYGRVTQADIDAIKQTPANIPK